MSSRAESSISPEILDARGEALVKGVKSAIDNGLPWELVQVLEDTNKPQHQDLFKIYLGLKPVATILPDVFQVYMIDKDYFQFFPQEKELGIPVIYEATTANIWNPDAVQKVINQKDDYQKIVASSNLPPVFKDPNDIRFSYYLNSITGSATSEERLLAGVLHGIPEHASELFTQYFFRFGDVFADLLAEADKHGLESNVDDYFSFGEIVANHHGMRDEFLRLAKILQYPDNGLIDYISETRFADIPGTPFITSGETTMAEEAEMRREYKLSGIDKRMSKLLSTFKGAI